MHDSASKEYSRYVDADWNAAITSVAVYVINSIAVNRGG